MHIIEVKNNLAKLVYNPEEDNIILSGFVSVKDDMHMFLAQIINIEAKSDKHYAIIKILFNYDNNGSLLPYNGAAPSLMSELESLKFQDIVEVIEAESPLFLGQIQQENMSFIVDTSILKKKILVCVEHSEEKDNFIKTIVPQVIEKGEKVLIFDLLGNFNVPNKVIAGDNFKLPLNFDTINFIYEKGLDGASRESRALIQDIFLEVQNYVKDLPEKFIPFENFKAVVDAEYDELKSNELVILKNKLLKYDEDGVFAQNRTDFETLNFSLLNSSLTVVDISKFDGALQREFISYVYSVLKDMNENVYSIVDIDDDNTDKKLLKQIFITENVYSIIVAPYKYKYLKEIKQLSKNLILFTPIQQQDDFAGYNIFLSKLNNNEFIVYGDKTHYIPFIVSLTEIKEDISAYQRPNDFTEDILEQNNYTEEQPQITEEYPQNIEDVISNDISNEITEPVQEMTEDYSQEEVSNSEEQEQPYEEITEPVQEMTEDYPQEEVPNSEEQEQPYEEITEPVQEMTEDYPQEEVPYAEEQVQPYEEITEPVQEMTEDYPQEEVPYAEEQKQPYEEITEPVQEVMEEYPQNIEDVISNDISNEISLDSNQPYEEVIEPVQEMTEDYLQEEVPYTEEQVQPYEEISEPVQEIIEDYPQDTGMPENISMSEEETLTDDDLDFIEENITPEIPVQEPQQPQVSQPQMNVPPPLPELYSEPTNIDEVEVSQLNAMPHPELVSNQAMEDDTPPHPELYSEEPAQIIQPQPQQQEQEFKETPIVPVYPAEQTEDPKSDGASFAQGDVVMHETYGKGVVTKIISYGDKVLCSIEFEEAGKKLLDPAITQLTKM